MVDDTRRPWRQAHGAAVFVDNGVRYLAGASQFNVFREMAKLSVNGDGNLGPKVLVHARQFISCGMTRDVDHSVFGRNHMDAPAQEFCLKLRDGPFIPRDDPGRENQCVARVQDDAWMIFGGNAGERCARLALTAGTDDQRLVIWQEPGVLLHKEERHVFHIAVFSSRICNSL